MNKVSKRAFVLGLTALAAAGLASSARAADTADLEAAKKEGKIAWYTSTPIETANRIAKLFEEKTGIKVEIFRSGGTAVLRRFMQEYDAKRIGADVLTTSDPAASKKAAEAVQRHAFEFVPIIPTGQFILPTAYRSNISGLIIAPINLLWNVEKK